MAARAARETGHAAAAAGAAGRAAFRLVRRAGTALVDLLVPPMCLTCDRPVSGSGQFCLPCFRKARLINGICCNSCGTPFGIKLRGGGGTTLLCQPCADHPPSWTLGRSAMLYDDHARRILLPFKYGDRIELARAIAPMMARAGARLLDRADLLVPVPLHRLRMLGRRYNQSALLARQLSRLSGRPAVLDALLRTRRTPALHSLTGSDRQFVMEGAIAANPRRLPVLRDAKVLLIDDILTTGATAESCAQALLAAGAGSVDVLTAARVGLPRHV